MLARVVESVYWLARYLERAENTARLVSVNTNLLLDLPRLRSWLAAAHRYHRQPHALRLPATSAAMSARSCSS